MSDFVILNGDQAMFDASFSGATVIAPPGTMSGTGRASVNGSTVCVEGDEASVIVAGVVYMTPVYSIPGTGTLRITSLGSDQLSENGSSDGRKLIVKGGTFQAELSMTSPAMQPQPPPSSPIPDSTPTYSGTGSFITTNTVTKA